MIMTVIYFLPTGLLNNSNRYVAIAVKFAD